MTTAPSAITLDPVVFGVVGLGGYARSISEHLLAETRSPSPVVKLTCAVEPDHVTHAERIAQLREQGIQVFRKYEDLLDMPIEAVWLPVPIDLHRRFTEIALGAGKAVMCEKPVAGSVDDVDAMIAARDRARLPVAVGFQHIYDPAISEVKRRILRGDIGKIVSATLHGCWPRDERYYRRNAWAGRYRRAGTWVLDTPANNAMAHFINLSLYLLGPSAGESAVPISVEAELYRAKPIETYDTCAMRYQLANGLSLLTMLTHACRECVDPVITITGEQGSVRFVNTRMLELTVGGRTERFPAAESMAIKMMQRFAKLLRAGDSTDIASLESSRAHVVAVNGASEAAMVQNIDGGFVDSGSHAIHGIESLFTQCAAAGRMPHESGLAKWTAPAGAKDLHNYTHFAGPRG